MHGRCKNQAVGLMHLVNIICNRMCNIHKVSYVVDPFSSVAIVLNFFLVLNGKLKITHIWHIPGTSIPGDKSDSIKRQCIRPIIVRPKSTALV